MIENFVNSIQTKKSKIGIFGMGYVGLPLMIRFSEVGFKVIGFDIDKTKIDKLNNCKSYIEHIPDETLVHSKQNGFEATCDTSRIKECDAVIICVPTPLNKYREPDLQFVLSTMDSIAPYLRHSQIVSLESTTYPGTTDEVLKPRIEKQGLEVGKDVFLVYSPEREDPGNIAFTTKTIPKVCGGVTLNCLEAGISLYSQIIDQVVPVSSTRAAEMTKLMENIHRAVNIGLVNEMKILSDRMNIDVHEVINAAATKPFGFKAYYPGPGLGGHCIPIDPFYLTWKAREFGLHTRFIELAGEVNNAMPDYVVSKTVDALNSHGKALRGSKILVLGIAYKKDIDDVRESPSVIIMEKLRDKGAELAYSDPHVSTFPKMREHQFELSSIALNKKTLSSFDAIILATDHKKFDFNLIKKAGRLIIDTRGVYQKSLENVVKA